MVIGPVVFLSVMSDSPTTAFLLLCHIIEEASGECKKFIYSLCPCLYLSCKMSYICVHCCHIWGCQTYHIVPTFLFQNIYIPWGYTDWELCSLWKVPLFWPQPDVWNDCHILSMHHSVLKYAVLSTVCHGLPILPTALPRIGKWRNWRMWRKMPHFITFPQKGITNCYQQPVIFHSLQCIMHHLDNYHKKETFQIQWFQVLQKATV